MVSSELGSIKVARRQLECVLLNSCRPRYPAVAPVAKEVLIFKHVRGGVYGPVGQIDA
jgi:hypothetical protein